jgi:drug/metabolite transporter (DMT)-like permease
LIASLQAWRGTPYLLLSLAAFMWAINWVVGRGMRDAIPPVAMGFWRWVIALAILIPLAAPELRRQWPIVRANWRILTLIGTIGAAGYNTIVYVGLKYTPATNAVLFNALPPALIILMTWTAFGDRPSTRQMLGVVISFLGILTIISRGNPAVITDIRSYPGDLWLLAAMLMWSAYTVLLRWRPEGLSSIGFLTVIALFGLPVLAPFYVWELSNGAQTRITLANAATLAYFGIFPSILAYLFYNYGVAKVGASRAGLFTHLTPVFGALLAILTLGERLELYHLPGIALIVIGIYLSSLGDTK